MVTEYETTPDRVVKGLLSGAVAGATLVAFPFLIFPPFVGIVFIFAFVVFVVGLIIIGGPFWILFHALHWRSARAATALGFCATFATIAVYGISLDRSDTAFMLVPAIVLGFVGAAVGRTIWAVAYRPVDQAEQLALFFE